MKLLIATSNSHKVREISAILDWPSVTLVARSDFPNVPEVIEDGATFEANALKKAVVLARATGLWALADDSGLVVDALGGEPGVLSARYAGEPADYEANNRKLLRELGGCVNRAARFRCVIALSSPAEKTWTAEGTCEGTIAEAPWGKAGFGYDPLFIPEGYSVTYAEMAPELKNRISHRAAALQAAHSLLERVLHSAMPA